MIRALESRDIDAVLGIQSTCREIAQWTVWDYHRVARGEMAGWVAEEGRELTGFLVARRVSSDLEILNFAVRDAYRRRGIGGELLRSALEWARSLQVTHAILEVRASNLAALRFYERYKFEVVGRRPRYYTVPIEDALLLTASLA
ncbi:MAG: ribosomal protein S18-alanine N-acetyltransferase [Candidatus Acidiferrales bacterium]